VVVGLKASDGHWFYVYDNNQTSHSLRKPHVVANK